MTKRIQTASQAKERAKAERVQRDGARKPSKRKPRQASGLERTLTDRAAVPDHTIAQDALTFDNQTHFDDGFGDGDLTGGEEGPDIDVGNTPGDDLS